MDDQLPLVMVPCLAKGRIKNVVINNWQPPGADWWEGVRRRPDDLLIDATIRVRLSWREYSHLLNDPS